MSVKMMMTGTGVMFAGIAGMAANRLSGGAMADAIAKPLCGDRYMAEIDGAPGEAGCGFNADTYWFAGMAALFLLGVAINVYGRIKAAK